ncbi:hypothetical protein LTR56_025773 [Elasticomyces elasticus]|nr:hypothetical protein LTR56_025773 [Elasticomyces elasticus]
MDLSNYLCQNEITQLNQVFEISLQHNSALVFWTGISPDFAKSWAHMNDLKTLTMAMGSLYTDKKRRSHKSTKSWSKYMKGASWVFAQHACHDRYAIVLTNAPPNVYSTREHSNYREIEEPILKGSEADQHAIQIEYVHPTVPGAECFRYQIWPNNRSSDWLAFIENIAVKQIVNNIVWCANLQSSSPHHGSEKMSSVTPFVTYGEGRKQEISREKKAAKRLEVVREQQVTEEKKAAKRLKAEREQQAAEEKKAAKQIRAAREHQASEEKKAAKRPKAKKEQQAAEEKKKAAKRLKAERKQQAAREKKAAERLKAEREQQATREKKVMKQIRAAKEQQAAEKRAAKRPKAEREQQVAEEKKAAKRPKAGRDQQAAEENKAAKQIRTAREQQQAAEEKKAVKRLELGS